MMFSTAIARPLQLVIRTLQWSSAVIVMGLTSYFIARGPKGQHIIYQEVIVRAPAPSSDLKYAYSKQESKSNTTVPGRYLRRLLPARLHLALHAQCAEQVRPDD